MVCKSEVNESTTQVDIIPSSAVDECVANERVSVGRERVYHKVCESGSFMGYGRHLD